MKRTRQNPGTGMMTQALACVMCMTLMMIAACDEGGKSSRQTGQDAGIVKTADGAAASSTSSGQGTALVPGLAGNRANVLAAVPETQYPLKQLPLPVAEKHRGDSINPTLDPTLPAYRALLSSATAGIRTISVPFFPYKIPDPLSESAGIVIQTKTPDAVTPVSATTGRPLPTLK